MELLRSISTTSHQFLPSPSPSSSCTATFTTCRFDLRPRKSRVFVSRVTASIDRRRETTITGTTDTTTSSSADRLFGTPVMEAAATSTSGTMTTAVERSFGSSDSEIPKWEKIGAIVRFSYGIGVYGAMALAGKFICSMAGIDWTGGCHASLKAVVEGLGYAAPPIMALLFILDDEIVKHSPHARAIRDAEDEELRSFFYGMSPWQFILIVAASSIGEELFYRVAVQGALADMFLRGTELVKDARGIASLTGMLPLFVPFAQAFAAAITAGLTSSLYYIATAPKDPMYIVSPVVGSHTGRENLRKLFAAWYERRQMKKIYSPLLEGLLALYIGFEWIQTDNILAPMITHGIYSATILGHGLSKIYYHRRRLRKRVQKVSKT